MKRKKRIIILAVLVVIGGVVAHNQGLFPKYTSGEYHEGTTTMIVNRKEKVLL